MDAPAVRASDAERETTATRLQHECAAGRLTPEELSERLDRVYAARETRELAVLTADLPEPSPPPRATPSRAHRLRVAGLQSATPFIVCVLVWLFSGASGQFWPMWVAIPLVMRMLAALRDDGRPERERHRRDSPLPPPPAPRRIRSARRTRP